MKDRSRLYNSIALAMVALSASLCTIVTIISLATVTGRDSGVGDRPTPTALPGLTDAAQGSPPDGSMLAATRTPGPRPTRAPLPTWTPLPTDTLPPGETAEPTDQPGEIPTVAADAPPLELIATLPIPRDVPEVALEVDLHYPDRWARVEQAVQVRNTSDRAWDEVVFSIPLAVLGGFVLDSAAAGSPEKAVDAKLDGIMLRVPLPRSIPPGLLARVNLKYRVRAPEVSIYTSFPAGNNGVSDGVLRLGEWYPAIAPFRNGKGWETWKYQPTGDPTIYPAANTTLAVKAPRGVTVVSGGYYGGEGDVWRFRVEEARAMPIFASDRFDKVEGTVDNMPVRCFTLGENRDAANGAIDIARKAISLYDELYGPYPFKSLDIVENGYFGDMEYSGLVSISNRGFVTNQGELTLLMHTLLAHEVAHQWWYGGVGNDQVYEPWLDESLASYSEALYYEHYINTGANSRMANFRSQDLGTTIDLTIYDYPTAAQYKQALYPRSAIFLDALRSKIGDAAFFAFLKDYQAKFRGRLATTADFFATLRAHTDADLEPLLDAYFADPNR